MRSSSLTYQMREERRSIDLLYGPFFQALSAFVIIITIIWSSSVSEIPRHLFLHVPRSRERYEFLFRFTWNRSIISLVFIIYITQSFRFQVLTSNYWCIIFLLINWRLIYQSLLHFFAFIFFSIPKLWSLNLIILRVNNYSD